MAIDWKPFSPKALDSIWNSNAFINILEGAVRSSKTLDSIIAWLGFIEQSPHNEFLMTGKTSDTLYRNVIDGATGILAIMGKRAKYNKSSQGGAKLTIRFGKNNTKICYCIGAHNEASEGRIRGMTIAGWYADEVTLYPESFVKQAINRMSLSGARAYWTTNPDSPYHYIKTEFIDKAAEKDYKHWHFELDDNYSLSAEYKENLKKAYSGLWYKRMVLGLWVQAEGAIYDMWDENTHIVNVASLGLKFKEYGVAADYATASVMTFGLYGITKDDKVYLLKEYYYDATKKGRQKTDSEFADDFTLFLGDIKPRDIFLDPSAASFKAELRKRGHSVKDANNDVINGIRLVANFLSSGRYFIDKSCTATAQEATSYVWDAKAQAKGIDKPLKENDHAMDRDRYFIYSKFGKPRAKATTYRSGMR